MAVGAPDPLIPIIQALGTIGGRYANLQWIGKATAAGHFSLLFEARDNQTGDEVAVKFYHPRFNADFYRRACFTREARLLTEFEGEGNVVQIVSGEQTIDVPVIGPGGIPFPVQLAYYATELADGSLTDYIYSPANNPMDTLILFREVCKGAQRIHAHDTAHRDLKPGNCLLFPRKEVKICDFGTARQSGDPLMGSHDVYHAPVGDLRYSAPELFCGLGRYHQYLATADVFSLGAILFEMLTRQVLTDLMFDRQLLMALIALFSRTPEDRKKELWDSMVSSYTGNLPSLTPSDLIPTHVTGRLEALYKTLADVDYRRRGKVSYEWVFSQIAVSLKIMQHERKYQQLLEQRKRMRENRERRQMKLRARRAPVGGA